MISASMLRVTGGTKRQLGVDEHLPDGLAHGGELSAGVQLVDLLPDALAHVVGVEELPVRDRGGGEPAGHPDAAGRQPLDHLAERGVLATEDLTLARTSTLTTLVLFQKVHVFNCRSENMSLFHKRLLANKVLLVGVLTSLAIHVRVLYLP